MDRYDRLQQHVDQLEAKLRQALDENARFSAELVDERRRAVLLEEQRDDAAAQLDLATTALAKSLKRDGKHSVSGRTRWRYIADTASRVAAACVVSDDPPGRDWIARYSVEVARSLSAELEQAWAAEQDGEGEP